MMHIIGDVAGRDCVMVDDMIDTGGTLCKAAEALKERGAKRVFAYATHPIFSGNAIQNIKTLSLMNLSSAIPFRWHQKLKRWIKCVL
nr:Ribose-phosphate pyrophosphokinase [Klebsiella pneumoniae]